MLPLNFLSLSLVPGCEVEQPLLGLFIGHSGGQFAVAYGSGPPLLGIHLRLRCGATRLDYTGDQLSKRMPSALSRSHCGV